MCKDRRYYTDANRAAWDEVAPLHAQQNLEKLLEAFALPGYSSLDEHCHAPLMEIGVQGKSVAQICCNNGRELLSMKNLGAGRCVGFDASAPFIEQARQLAKAAGHEDVSFVAADVYDVPKFQDATFDIVLSTIGVLSWMPDLPAFFGVAAGLTNRADIFLLKRRTRLCRCTNQAKMAHRLISPIPISNRLPGRTRRAWTTTAVHPTRLNRISAFNTPWRIS